MNSGGTSVLRSSCVKIYLCSNPEDSVLERRALRDRVLPQLREECRRTLGLDIRVIDPFESSDPGRWPDEDTRQQLISECRESSAGPFLLALVGHQYGAASLPTQVEVSQYQLLLHEGQKGGISTQEVERLYQRDENCIPASYCLTSPSTLSSGPQVKEGELVKVFQASASLCVSRGVMATEAALRYRRSALDADLRFALEGRLESDLVRRCVVYIHKVVNADAQTPKPPKTMAPTEDLSNGPLLSQLCDDFLPALVDSSQILVYTTTTECDHRYGYTTSRRKGYVEALCQQVHKDLMGLIKRANISETRADVQVCDALAREAADQEDVCGILSSFYDVVRPEEEKVRHYVEHSEHQLPLVVTGGPCTGKAVLLARCAQQIQSWLPGRDPVVLTYFCTQASSFSPKQLLSRLCQQVSRRYQQHASCFKQNLDSPTEPRGEDAELSLAPDPELHRELSDAEATPDCWKNTTEVQRQFSSLLSLVPSTKQPLVLILDGLDHIHNHIGTQIIRSLPSPLPPNVKVILSVSSTGRQILQGLSPQHRQGDEEESGFVSVPLGTADRKQCLKMLASLLRGSGRKVTSGQQALVNRALTSCSLALYVRLLHLHASLWRSDSNVAESSLPIGVHPSISALLDHLEQKHGSAMVGRAVSYLTLSRTGLSEAELADLLSCDDRVLSSYLRQGEKAPSVLKVPHIDVETLLLDLRRFLIGRTVAGLRLLSWASRHFQLVIAKRYLFTPESRKEVHSSMAEYFSSRWSGGQAKPLLISQKPLPNHENVQIPVHADRQASSQPLHLPDSPEHRRVDMRTVLELPHHLQESGRWEQMEREVLMSFRFHQAMIEAGLLGDLLAMLESGDGRSHCRGSRRRAFLTAILRSRACFLQSSPLQLPTVMETSLLPYLGVFPALKGYINDIQVHRRTRDSTVQVALCPAPSSVPPVRCLELSGGVADLAVTDCGVVAQISHDGTAWVWTGPGYHGAKLSLTSEQQQLRFTGVRSSAHFILLSTLCTRLLFWNVKGPERLVPLQVPLPSNQEEPSKIGGFVARQTKLFSWWEQESCVSLFHMWDEAVTHFQCQRRVTCCLCSSDGAYLCCGQEDGVLSLFDTVAGGVLATWSNSSRTAVLWMKLSEEKWELACGDRAGSVSVWAVTARTPPPTRIKERPSGGGPDVLNTDSSDDAHLLLVCQARRVWLWDMCDWELWGGFWAPEGRLFAGAVLSQSGQLMVALLDARPSVLVWRVHTGECVLSLQADTPPHTLLKTSSGVVCVDPRARLTAWDSATIEAAAAAPRMGDGVKEVAAEAAGEHFYTADGSDTVWRWHLGTGLPRAHVQHQHPVDKVRLSPDGLHLVTLSAGDIFVWKTGTGENVVRVRGSGATEVLICPNSNVAVSIAPHVSQVWRLTRGSVVCSIRPHLADAQVSPESTFLIGRCHGDLLAASLWSGSISRRFSSVCSSDRVAAFHTLWKHPDLVVVMCASGRVCTWNIAQETLCRHLQLPHPLRGGPPGFQMTSDGSCALLSVDDQAIAILDLSRLVIRSLQPEGRVLKMRFDRSYVTYIWTPSRRDPSCACSELPQLLLTVVRLQDGGTIGSVCLGKRPLSLHLCERHRVFVGFDDGSVGVYCISDAKVSGEGSAGGEDGTAQAEKRPVERWSPLSAPTVTWL